MGFSQETLDCGTDPLIVVTEDGSKWINVEDVDEIEWLIKRKRSILENMFTHKCHEYEDEKASVYDDLDDLSSTETSVDVTNVVDEIIYPPWDRYYSGTNKKKQVTRDLHDRQRNSCMYEQCSVHDKPAVVKNIDGSIWFPVEDVFDDDKIIRETDLTETVSSTTDVYVDSIINHKVVAEKTAQCKRHKNDVNEKIVRVEYKVYMKDAEKPLKKLRAYLAIQNSRNNETQSATPIAKKDRMIELTNEEIKMIDTEIKQNKGYLDEIRDVIRTDRITKKHNRAISTQNFIRNDELLMHTHKLKHLGLEHQMAKNTPSQKVSEIYKQKSLISKNKTYSSFEPKSIKELLKPKSTVKDIKSRQYSGTVYNSSAHINNLKHKLAQKHKYMRNLKEIDCFNEKMVSIYVDVY